MRRVRLARGAIADIRHILRRSKDDFGPSANAPYKALIDQALRDLADDPERIGVRPIPDARTDYHVYHLEWSKRRMPGPSVGWPRVLHRRGRRPDRRSRRPRARDAGAASRSIALCQGILGGGGDDWDRSEASS
jgi:plasmid stabilization system protein ParE